MRHNNYGICKVLSIVAATLMLSSCAEEIWFSDKPMETTDVLTFGMGLPEGWQEPGKTRTGTEGQDTVGRPSIYVTEPVCFDETINGDTITIYAIVEDIPSVTVPIAAEDAKSDTTASTRASDVDSKYDLGVYSYVMTKGSETTPPGYTGANTGLAQFMMNTHVDVDDDFSYSPIKYWPGPDYWVKFFAYSPHITNANSIIGAGQTNFSISAPANIPEISCVVPTNASKQLDITICNHAMLAGDNNQQINFTMSHIMSAVKVKVGNIPEGKVNYIKLTNLKNSATRVLNAASWTIDDTKTTDFIQSFETALTPTAGDQIGETFYLMPQSLSSENIEIEIKLTIDTREYILTKSLKAILGEGASWQEGKQYTFVITTPEEVKVEVDDEVVYNDGVPIKQNLTITNTGLADAYIRVALIGSWLVDQVIDGENVQVTIDNWKREEDGVFNWGAEKPEISKLNSKGWQLGSDGYFYYLGKLKSDYPIGIVKPGDKLPELFDSYTLTASAPLPGAYLELAVVVQGVLYCDNIEEIFPADILTALGK